MRFSNFLARHKIKFVSFVFFVLFFFAFFFQSIFVYVYPGQSAVLFRALSSQPIEQKVYREGLYTIAPWNKMYIYDLTKQRVSLDIDALTSNGLTIKLHVTSIFYPKVDELATLTRNIGKDYLNKIISPTVFSSTREIIGNYLPENLYTTDMHIIQDQILEEAHRELAGLPFEIEQVVVEKIELPSSINKAIEFKLKHQQDALAYQYILQGEEAEAKRRKIEAESVQAYNNAIKSSLNDDVLEWLKIKALADLSKTENSKVIVFDGDRNSVPVVIDAKVE